MEVVQYLCEFFFTDFTHFLGLVVIAAIIFAGPKIVIERHNK